MIEKRFGCYSGDGGYASVTNTMTGNCIRLMNHDPCESNDSVILLDKATATDLRDHLTKLIEQLP